MQRAADLARNFSPQDIDWLWKQRNSATNPVKTRGCRPKPISMSAHSIARPSFSQLGTSLPRSTCLGYTLDNERVNSRRSTALASSISVYTPERRNQRLRTTGPCFRRRHRQRYQPAGRSGHPRNRFAEACAASLRTAGPRQFSQSTSRYCAAPPPGFPCRSRYPQTASAHRVSRRA